MSFQFDGTVLCCNGPRYCPTPQIRWRLWETGGFTLPPEVMLRAYADRAGWASRVEGFLERHYCPECRKLARQGVQPPPSAQNSAPRARPVPIAWYCCSGWPNSRS